MVFGGGSCVCGFTFYFACSGEVYNRLYLLHTVVMSSWPPHPTPRATKQRIPYRPLQYNLALVLRLLHVPHATSLVASARIVYPYKLPYTFPVTLHTILPALYNRIRNKYIPPCNTLTAYSVTHLRVIQLQYTAITTYLLTRHNATVLQ